MAANAARAAVGRRAIAATAVPGVPLHIDPLVIGRGSVEHYYHFLFDLVLPLFLLARCTSPHVPFLVDDPGPLGIHLAPLFGSAVHLVPRGTSGGPRRRARLVGLNPRLVYLSRRTLARFASAMLDRLDVPPRPDALDVLLVERAHPDAYYDTTAAIPTSGARRRSIANHAEVASTLESLVPAAGGFSNLQLERMSLRDQVCAFARARAVVAQHGAALANMVWMKPGSLVIELTHDTRLDHFRIIADRLALRHVAYPVAGSHPTIDIPDFRRWIGNLTEWRDRFDRGHDTAGISQ